jgi:hypothetical protein
LFLAPTVRTDAGRREESTGSEYLMSNRKEANKDSVWTGENVTISMLTQGTN